MDIVVYVPDGEPFRLRLLTIIEYSPQTREAHCVGECGPDSMGPSAPTADQHRDVVLHRVRLASLVRERIVLPGEVDRVSGEQLAQHLYRLRKAINSPGCGIER